MRIAINTHKSPRREILRLAAIVGIEPTIGALAAACNLNRDTVADALELRKPPRPSTVRALADTLRTTPEVIKTILAGGQS